VQIFDNFVIKSNIDRMLWAISHYLNNVPFQELNQYTISNYKNNNYYLLRTNFVQFGLDKAQYVCNGNHLNWVEMTVHHKYTMHSGGSKLANNH